MHIQHCMNGYRRILHIDRTMTNDHVKPQIRNHLSTEINMFSSMCYNLLQLKISLLGHISRSEPNDPRRVLFEKGTLINSQARIS